MKKIFLVPIFLVSGLAIAQYAPMPYQYSPRAGYYQGYQQGYQQAGSPCDYLAQRITAIVIRARVPERDAEYQQLMSNPQFMGFQIPRIMSKARDLQMDGENNPQVIYSQNLVSCSQLSRGN